MKAWVFFYQMKDLDSKTRTQLLNHLFGKRQQSNYGQYRYNIKGLVPEGAYIKPVRAVIIVKKRYALRVAKFLEEEHIPYKRFEIVIERDEFEKREFF